MISSHISLVLMKMKLEISVMWKIFLCHVLCYSLMMSHNRGMVEAVETLRNDEHMEIKQKLKLINKPAIKIIKSIDGELYGCVDFYNQPGFDHPSMKNHTFNYKMRMTSYPEGSKMQREKKNFGHLWENGVGCPVGTVPIRRVTKDDLLRLNSLGDHNSNPRGSWNNTYGVITSSNDNNHHVSACTLDVRTFAVVRTKGPRSYYGASMNVEIFSPPVKDTQFSSARMLVQIGNEFIQAGWTANLQLNGDGRSRLFVFTNAGGHQCYNNKCPGFILVRPEIAPGLLLMGRDVAIALVKDKANGNWWLLFQNEEVGFWPSSTFKERLARGIEWGGEAYSPYLPSPPMGNGHFPIGNPNIDSFIRYISIIDENYVRDNIVENTEPFADNGYKVIDAAKSVWTHVGHVMVYGGPGLRH